MSTCPDKSLYSAYIDGEVPSPWKEKLEEHLASCEKCSKAKENYRAICLALQKMDEPFLKAEFLESSFRELSPRWEIAAEKAVMERVASVPIVSRKAVRVPWFALAAMFLVAAFVPSFFAVKAMEGRAAESYLPMQAFQNSDDDIFPAGFQNGGYGRHGFPPSSGAIYVTAGAESGSDFPLINRARMFAQDKEVFSAPGSEYVIIRLPEMIRFRGEHPEREWERSERDFAPMPPRHEDGRDESGHIINVSQQ